MIAADDSLTLLRRYAQTRDAAAFEQIVARYINLVYTAAARRVGDRHLAQDVTQAVFIILANKAGRIRREADLSGWLLTTVRYAAANALKMQRRRQRRERAILSRQSAQSGVCSTNPADVLIWQDVAAELDDAILRLPALDRTALLQRYFEDRPIGEIALSLKASEGAVKQRLHRALERLRDRLQRRGVDLELLPAGGIAGLTGMLTANAVKAAPPGLYASTCAAATGSVKLMTATTIAKGAVTMMKWNAAKLAAATVAAAVVVGGVGGVWTINRAAAQNDSPKPARSATARDELFVQSPAVIVSATPQAGNDAVDPKTAEIKIKFSKDMSDGSWSWAQMSDETFPKITGKPHYEADHRTCVLPVKLEANHAYVLLLNRPPFTNFVDQDGHKAVEYWLTFKTKAE